MANNSDMEISVNSASTTTERDRGSSITECSVLSYLTNASSSSKSFTPSDVEDLAARIYTKTSSISRETVDSDITDDHINKPGVITGHACDQLVRERDVYKPRHGSAINLGSDPTGLLVQSADTNTLDNKMGNGSDISFDITQHQNVEVKDDADSEKWIGALKQQRIKDNVEDMAMVLRFPTKIPVTIYSVLQCVERAQFSSASEQLSKTTENTIARVPANCEKYKYNLRNIPKISYSMDHLSDDDISEYVTSDFDYLESDDESKESSVSSDFVDIPSENKGHLTCRVCGEKYLDWQSLHDHMKRHNMRKHLDISGTKSAPVFDSSHDVNSRFQLNDMLPECEHIGKVSSTDQHSTKLTKRTDDPLESHIDSSAPLDDGSPTVTALKSIQCGTAIIPRLEIKISKKFADKERSTSTMDIIEPKQDNDDKTVSNMPQGDYQDCLQNEMRKAIDMNITETEYQDQPYVAFGSTRGRTPLRSEESVTKNWKYVQDMDFDEVMKCNACHVCPVCKHVSRKFAEFEKHFRSSYRCLNTYLDCTGTAYVCSLCNFKGKRRYNLLRHLGSARHNLQEVICFPADSVYIKTAHALERFSERWNVTNEQNTDVGQNNEETTVSHDRLLPDTNLTRSPLLEGFHPEYCCQICGAVRGSHKTAKHHLKSHSDIKIATCHLCNKTCFGSRSFHDHMEIHNMRKDLDISGTKSAPASDSSDELNSRFHGNDMLPECEHIDTVSSTDQHSTKLTTRTDDPLESHIAISAPLHGGSPTDTALKSIQRGTAITRLNKNNNIKKFEDKAGATSKMNIIERKQDKDDNTVSNMPQGDDQNGCQKEMKTATDMNITKKRKFMRDADFDKVMKCNASHVCPVCKHVSAKFAEFEEHFRYSYKCSNKYRDCTGTAYTCSLCDYKCKGLCSILRHLISKRHNLQEAVYFPTGSLSNKTTHTLQRSSQHLTVTNEPNDEETTVLQDRLTSDTKLTRLPLLEGFRPGYCCQICGVSRCSYKAAKYHLNKIHPNIKIVTCHLCNKTCFDRWSFHNHMELHSMKTILNISGTTSSACTSSDTLDSHFHVKDTLADCEHIDAEPTTDKQPTKLTKETDDHTESYTAIGGRHHVDSLTEREHKSIQHGSDIIIHKPSDGPKHGDKGDLTSKVDIAELTQDKDNKTLVCVRPVNDEDGYQKHTTKTTENSAENKDKHCFAFGTSKCTRNVIFEQTEDYQRYHKFEQLLIWNASHKCPVCRLVSGNNKDFHAHFLNSEKCRRIFLDTSTSGIRYSCKPCSYLHVKFDHLMRHLIRKQTHGELTCMSFPTSNSRTDSDEEYVTELNLSDEINAHDGDESMNRRQSGKQHAKLQNATAGINADTHQSKTFKAGFSCQICGVVKFKFRDASAHLLRHTGDTIYECQTCKDHLVLKVKFNPEHLCGNCGSTHFKLRSKSTGKLVSHSIQKAYECLLCNEYFVDSGDFNVHMQHHVEMQCTCGRCSKMYLQSAKAEVKRQANLQKKCDFCEKVFQSKYSLDLHYQSHSESVKPVICDICGDKFANRPSLLIHIERKHLSTKKCTICKKTVDKDVFKSHMKLHPRQSRFTCDQCGKMFKYLHHLSNHLLSHTNERSFICKHCGYAFKMKHHMESHILTKHTAVTNSPVMKNTEGETRKPVATKTKRKASKCQKRIDDKSGKATMTKRKRKRTTNSSSAEETDIPKRKLRRHHLNENGKD